MIEIVCHTNLDLCNEEWPDKLPALPRVGDRIQSATKHKDKFRLELEVCSVTWECVTHKEASFYDDDLRTVKNWIPRIELHLTSYHKGLYPPQGIKGEKGSIVAFYHWYAPLVGKIAGNFI